MTPRAITSGRGSATNDRRYWHPDLWLQANARIIAHPQAAHLIVSRYSSREWKDARRTAVCAAGFNTPLWQDAVAEAYPPTLTHPERTK